MSRTEPLYRVLASRLGAIANCKKSGNAEWLQRHTEYVAALVKEHMPAGAGFDCGTKLDLELSHSERLVFTTSFHHMDENGSYDGWTERHVTVLPQLSCEFRLLISGPNRNDCKEYFHETFALALQTQVAV